MNEIEAQRIASVIGIIRPDWRNGLVMAVLGDERMRHRTYADALVAMVAMSVDPTSLKPGRVHEPGRWWLTVTATEPNTVTYREVTDADCAICGRVAGYHSPLSSDPHAWEPQHARGQGVGPTPEQRAAIDAANHAAELARTAAKEAAEEREKERLSIDDILARHVTKPTDEIEEAS